MTIQRYKTISGEGTGEIVEKKSRFICNLYHIESEEEAANCVAALKKEHYQARHVCYAYILGEKSDVLKYSDDGEPSGTAGRPMLDILKGRGLTYSLCCVTRYFGGVLLGTGGLVRAYTQSTKAALDNATLCEMIPCVNAKTVCSYSDYNILLPLLLKYECEITDTVFENDTTVYYKIKSDFVSQFEASLSEKFAGKLKFEQLSDGFLKKILKK